MTQRQPEKTKGIRTVEAEIISGITVEMNAVLLLLGLHSRHLKANSKGLMSKTQRTENYRGPQNISSYIAGMATSLTSVNLDSFVRIW